MFLLQEKALPLREIMTRLERVYCGSIGAEFMHIPDIDQVTKWGVWPELRLHPKMIEKYSGYPSPNN